MTRFIIAVIYFYRWFISLFLPSRCRFEPTCSRYAINALECHGLIKGLWLTLKRLVRCHPYEKISQQMGVAWGYDPVPKKETANYSSLSHSNSKKN